MFGIGYIIWGIVILYVIISRGLPKFISWILCRALNAEVKIGRISLLPFSLKDVRICKNNFTVVIESIGVSSNLVNSSYSKILAIYVGDVRIEKELGEQPMDEGDDADLQEGVQGRPTAESNPSATNIPPQIITLSQITSIHVYNVNVMLLKIAKNCLFHATISEVKLEGTTDQAWYKKINQSIQIPKCKIDTLCRNHSLNKIFSYVYSSMQVSLNICNFASKLLHHVENVSNLIFCKSFIN